MFSTNPDFVSEVNEYLSIKESIVKQAVVNLLYYQVVWIFTEDHHIV